jgi:hypothetical protein
MAVACLAQQRKMKNHFAKILIWYFATTDDENTFK